MADIHDQIFSVLNGSSDRGVALTRVLRLVLAHFRSETGTIHRLDREEQVLQLVAESGLPPAMLEVVKSIPVGKGIAGQTVARGGPVSICNLQTDTTSVSRPAARQTGVAGALCVPLRSGGAITGTIGIGTLRRHEYTSEETQVLENIAGAIGEYLSRHP